MARLPVLGAFLLVIAATAGALLPLCATLHRCGCRAPWAGGRARCNVHDPQGPHCPWCEHPALGGMVVAGTIGGQGLAFLAARRRRLSVGRSALTAVAALPVTLFVSGAAAWLATDYPHFIVADARARLRLPPGPLACVARPVGGRCCGDSGTSPPTATH